MSFIARAAEFRDALSRRIVVADGAMGTMLYARGIFINRCFDELSLSAPDIVRQIHQEYVKAGAEILETNTFGATRVRLSAFGFAEKAGAINRAAVRLAREAAGDQAWVARSGRSAFASNPSGQLLSPRRARHFANRPMHW